MDMLLEMAKSRIIFIDFQIQFIAINLKIRWDWQGFAISGKACDIPNVTSPIYRTHSICAGVLLMPLSGFSHFMEQLTFSEIITLDSNVCSCHLIPRYGTKYLPAKWDSDSVLEQCKSFFLNKYLNSRLFLTSSSIKCCFCWLPIIWTLHGLHKPMTEPAKLLRPTGIYVNSVKLIHPIWSYVNLAWPMEPTKPNLAYIIFLWPKVMRHFSWCDLK